MRTRGKVSGLDSGIGIDGRVTAEIADLARFPGWRGSRWAAGVTVEAAGRGSLLGGDLDLTGEVRGDRLRDGPGRGGRAAGGADADRLFGARGAPLARRCGRWT